MQPDQIEAQLVSTFFETAGSFPVHQGCEQMMRQLIHDSVDLMVAQNATAPDALEQASDTVRAFTLEMKELAREQSRGSIGEFTFDPVLGRLRGGERQGWWPFTLRP